MARRDVVLQMHPTLGGFADSKTGFVPITDRPSWKELDKAFASTELQRSILFSWGRGPASSSWASAEDFALGDVRGCSFYSGEVSKLLREPFSVNHFQPSRVPWAAKSNRATGLCPGPSGKMLGTAGVAPGP
jgi:hypothetical protein